MKPPKSLLSSFSARPAARVNVPRSSAQRRASGNRWERQSNDATRRDQSRLSREPASVSRQSAGASQYVQTGDLDLTSALSARAAIDATRELPIRAASTLPPGKFGEKSGSRTGGRIRMDAPKAVRTGPRTRAIPSAPRYRQNAKPVNWRAIFLTTLITLVAAWSLTYLFSSPTLAIQSVQINGVTPDIAALLQADLPGDPIGSNIVRYALSNRRAIRKSIGGAEADFASVSIGIHLPHTLVINIVKRSPVALLVVGGQSWALDSRAVPIRIGGDPQISSLSLPRLEVASNADGGSAPELGRPLPDSLNRRVQDGFAVMKALRGQPGFSAVRSIQVDDLRNVTVALSNNLLVKIGQPIELESKLALANSLMQQRPDIAEQASYLDVSYPPRPAFLPKGVVVKSAGDGSGSNQTGDSATPQPVSAPSGHGAAQNAASLH